MILLVVSVLYQSKPDAVDENLFYKGVDKSIVHGARLHQSHSLIEPDYSRIDSENECSPPYPFVVRLNGIRHDLSVTLVV